MHYDIDDVNVSVHEPQIEFEKSNRESIDEHNITFLDAIRLCQNYLGF